MEATDNKFATAEDVKKEFVFLDSAKTFKTPGKSKRDPEAEDKHTSMGESKASRYKWILPMEKEELDKIVALKGMKKGVLTAVVSGLETNVISVWDSIEEVSLLTAAQFQALEDTVNLVSGVINNVRAGLGTPVGWQVALKLRPCGEPCPFWPTKFKEWAPSSRKRLICLHPSGPQSTRGWRVTRQMVTLS